MTSNWFSWSLLVLAAVYETAWAYCLKWMRFGELKQLSLHNFYLPQGLKTLLPFAGYIAFGIANVYFFSIATRHIALATAFAAWTGLSLVLIRLSGIVFLQQRLLPAEVWFMLMIMGGITGLKWCEGKD